MDNHEQHECQEHRVSKHVEGGFLHHVECGVCGCSLGLEMCPEASPEEWAYMESLGGDAELSY